MQLLLSLVGVEDVVLLGMSGYAACGSGPQQAMVSEIRLLHIGSRI